ncbi:hypothetical protein L3X38_016813 [Prunus dulcis]|uniref:Uncharacterized protein n=1 Tax=Prunus dulcis TaxID=3755 RepID=A0AAD4W7X5_PRUDU|nr:hypothetical protein L3X38_016813 [Prunus dulcis]
MAHLASIARWSWAVRCATLNLEEASWELTGFRNKSVMGGVGPAQSGQYLARWSWASPLRHSELRGGLLGAHWLRVRRNSEVKRVGGWGNPRMGDHPGKLLRELPETKPCGLVRM